MFCNTVCTQFTLPDISGDSDFLYWLEVWSGTGRDVRGSCGQGNVSDKNIRHTYIELLATPLLSDPTVDMRPTFGHEILLQ